MARPAATFGSDEVFPNLHAEEAALKHSLGQRTATSEWAPNSRDPPDAPRRCAPRTLAPTRSLPGDDPQHTVDGELITHNIPSRSDEFYTKVGGYARCWSPLPPGTYTVDFDWYIRGAVGWWPLTPISGRGEKTVVLRGRSN